MYHQLKLLEDQSLLLYAWFSAMFTRVDILISADNSRNDLLLVAEKLEAEIKRVEAFANRFDADSELSRLNRLAFENDFQASPELFQIISECLVYNKLTFGYFDITINSENGFKEGIANIHLDAEKQTIRFLHPDLKLDLCGFIKGYVLRAVRQTLEQEKISNALINLGNSSILALGKHPNGTGWKIGFAGSQPENAVVLQNQCLTTSGNSERTQWPIRQPFTGEKAMQKHPVSVITEDPAIGEVLSTALYMADEQEQRQILSQLKGILLDSNHLNSELLSNC
jgi:FAD:protein FMN transferase